MTLSARLVCWMKLGMLVLSGMLGLEASAANLQISPVMIILRAGQGATGITMQNMGETPVYGQVRVFLWDQNNTEDVCAQIGSFELSNARGKNFTIAEGLFGYVLAGREREWRLPVPADADLSGTLVV